MVFSVYNFFIIIPSYFFAKNLALVSNWVFIHSFKHALGSHVLIKLRSLRLVFKINSISYSLIFCILCKQKLRSEERRVGKECRDRVSMNDQNMKTVAK